MLIQGAQGGDNKTWGNKNPLAALTTHDDLMAATEGWSSICHSHYQNEMVFQPASFWPTYAMLCGIGQSNADHLV